MYIVRNKEQAMKIVIQTQVKENYGAHDWDGTGACPQYWKFKGGSTYVVPNLSVEQTLRIREVGLPTLTALIEERSDSFEEYILDWSIQDDDAVVCEPWETPFELTWEQGRWKASRVILNDEYGYMRADIGSKTEQYIMLMAGGRENYTVEYRDLNGEIMTLEVLTAA
jgi:hypothetical protein